jgi:hypothetical protein
VFKINFDIGRRSFLGTQVEFNLTKGSVVKSLYHNSIRPILQFIDNSKVYAAYYFDGDRHTLYVLLET